jgi:hypothetical protein
MSQVESAKLQQDSNNWYTDQMKKLEEKELHNQMVDEAIKANIDNPEFVPSAKLELSLQDKVFKILSAWWMRYVFAAAFIFLLPYLKDIINGMSSRKDDDEDDDGAMDEDDEFQEYLAFKRFKRKHL